MAFKRGKDKTKSNYICLTDIQLGFFEILNINTSSLFKHQDWEENSFTRLSCVSVAELTIGCELCFFFCLSWTNTYFKSAGQSATFQGYSATLNTT